MQRELHKEDYAGTCSISHNVVSKPLSLKRGGQAYNYLGINQLVYEPFFLDYMNNY